MTALGQRPALFARAMAGLRSRRAAYGDMDLPALDDPAVGLQRSATVLSVVTLGIVGLTAGSRIGAGYSLSDVGALLLMYGLATLAVARVPWAQLPPIAATGIIGAQILFIVSLTTVTGGGDSPYFALYAPILALAGWHLRREWLVGAVGAVAIVEWWRAMIVESRQGTADQLLVALPLFAAIAALAHLTSQRLNEAIVAIRRDQVRTAETLEAVRGLSSPGTDPLAAVSATAGRIFEAQSRVIPFVPPAARKDQLLARSEEGRRLSVAIASQTRTHGVLELERSVPFSSTEARLAAILGESAGYAAEVAPRGVDRATEPAT